MMKSRTNRLKGRDLGLRGPKMSMQRFASMTLVAVLSVPALQVYGQGGDSLQQRLNRQFPLTTITKDRTDVVTPGAVLVLQKDGLMMYSVASPVPPLNTYKNGKISQGLAGFGRDLKGTLLTPGNGTTSDYPQRKFVTGERMSVTGVVVEKDGIAFRLYSEALDGIHYYGELKFPFEKGSILPADQELMIIADVLTMPSDNVAQLGPIAGVYERPQATEDNLSLNTNGTFSLIQGGKSYQGIFTIADDKLTLRIGKRVSTGVLHGDTVIDDRGLKWVKQNSQAGAANPQPTSEAKAQVTDAPFQPIEPPPPPADQPPPPPQTISKGDTKDQVVEILGLPQRVVKAGTKEIFYFKDVKVTFVNGKVSDVE